MEFIEVTLKVSYKDEKGVEHVGETTQKVGARVLSYKHEKKNMLMALLPKMEAICMKQFLESNPKYSDATQQSDE